MSELMDHYVRELGLLAVPVEDLSTVLFERTATLPMRFIRRSPERPYMERYYLGQANGEFAYLHRFVGGDGDEFVHTHPWERATTMLLTGGYRELRREGDGPQELRSLEAGDIHVIHATSFHKIVDTDPETWTLFVHTDWIGGWGFENKDGEIVRNRSDPPGTNRLWWTKPEALTAHMRRTPFQLPPGAAA